MCSVERETLRVEFAGLGRVDRGEDLVWDIVGWTDEPDDDDEGVEADQDA